MKKVTAKAPVNIALIKYWGKEDEEKVIPFNSSLSLTLDNLYTITIIEESNSGFSFTLNNEIITGNEAEKVCKFLKHFASPQEIDKVRVVSENHVPTAAGLASSASAFSALSIASNTYFNTNLSFKQLCEVTRKGSGSACRSLLGGFVAWDKSGEVYEVYSKYKDFILISVIVNPDRKKISSSKAMAATVKTSPLYRYFVEENSKAFEALKIALESGNLKEIGSLTEKSFLMLHGVMMATNPPVLYMNELSIKVIEIIKRLRENNLYAYPTMDAGSNVKILTTESDHLEVIKSLEANGFNNYYISRLGDGAKIIYEEDC